LGRKGEVSDTQLDGITKTGKGVEFQDSRPHRAPEAERG